MSKSDAVREFLSQPEAWTLSNCQIARILGVDEKLVRTARKSLEVPSAARSPRTTLQTLSVLSPQAASFEWKGAFYTGTIAAVLVDWSTQQVSAVLINWQQGQIQLPISKVSIHGAQSAHHEEDDLETTAEQMAEQVIARLDAEGVEQDARRHLLLFMQLEILMQFLSRFREQERHEFAVRLVTRVFDS